MSHSALKCLALGELPPTRARRICLFALAVALTSGVASAEQLAWPVSGVDTFSFAAGYPTMGASGDYVEGSRELPDLPAVNALQFHLALDQRQQACEGAFSYTFDGHPFATGKVPAGADVLYIITEPLRVQPRYVEVGTQHSLRVELTVDLASCADGSHVRFIEEESWVIFDFVEDDLDDDGYISEDTLGDDCDDEDPSRHPGAEEICDDKIDQDCDGADSICPCEDTDTDGDGYGSGAACVAEDCNEGEAQIHPGASELEDGLDNDCDGRVDEGTSAGDTDGDGVSPAEGDCDDSNAAVYPGASEVSNNTDDDCDGQIDEGLAEPTSTPVPGSPTPTVDDDDLNHACGCSGAPARSPSLALCVLLCVALRRRASPRRRG